MCTFFQPTRRNTMDLNKSIFKSKIFWSSVVLFIIGLEPYIPTIQSLLPEHLGALFAIVLPALIAVARWYMAQTARNAITNSDIVELADKNTEK